MLSSVSATTAWPALAGGRQFVAIDSNGNLASKVEDGHSWSYEWNAEDQLKRVTKDTGEVARFAYDPVGRRVEKVAGGTTTSFAYDAVDILREARGASGTWYVHGPGPGVDQPLAQETGGVLGYLDADGLSSIVKITDASGVATLSRQYAAFGEPEAGGSVGGYAFTGREWEPETGLYYYRARYYEPKSGGFVSADPTGFNGGINFYAYVLGNPVNLVDAFGLDSYSCQVPAKGQPKDKGDRRYGPDIFGNPLHHDYLCVVEPDGTSSCGGFRPKVPPKDPFGPVPGEPSEDYFEPKRCTRMSNAPGSCFERCLKRKIDKKNPRPPYIMVGYNCQDWATEQYWTCFGECFMKGAGK